MNSYDRLRDAHRTWVEELLTKINGRERVWTESIAVGSKCFVEQTKTNLGYRAIGRSPREANGVYELRELQSCYGTDSGDENQVLSFKNTRLWNVYSDASEG